MYVVSQGVYLFAKTCVRIWYLKCTHLFKAVNIMQTCARIWSVPWAPVICRSKCARLMKFEMAHGAEEASVERLGPCMRGDAILSNRRLHPYTVIAFETMNEMRHHTQQPLPLSLIALSTLVGMKCTHDFMPNTRDGRYFRFGVREFGMSAICNGLDGMFLCADAFRSFPPLRAY